MKKLTLSRVGQSIVWRFLIAREKFLEFSPTRQMRRNQVRSAKQTKSTLVAYISAVGCKMIIDPETFFSQAYVLGSYEPHVVRYLKKILRPGMTCIDAGANIGYFTLLMARLVEPGGRVISFEPTQYSFNLLKENIRLNRLSSVTPEQIALFDHEGILEFHEGPPGFDVYNSAGEITHPSAVNQPFIPRSIRCTSIDAYLNTHHIGEVDVIKLDVEGAEFLVLKGLETTLQANSQAKLIFECADQTTRGFGYSARDLGTWFLERGWQLAVIDPFGKLSAFSDEQCWTGQMVVASRSF
jgi:FkbM family methyltransferase